MARRPSAVLATVVAFSIAACGWKVTPPAGAPPGSPPHIGGRVFLTMNDTALAWGDGRTGDFVRETLVAARVFDEVYYPVPPRTPTPLGLAVTARGTVDEEVALGVIKSIFIGLLFLVPAGVVRFGKTFDLDANVVFSDEGREVRRFDVHSKTHVSHTMFSHIAQYEAAARQAAFHDLGARIAAGLAGVTLETAPRPRDGAGNNAASP